MIDVAVSQLGILAVVMLLAYVSPGPDFVAVVSFALGGRRGGLGVALGVALASLAWATFAMAGLSVVLVHLGWLYEAIRIGGALYLVWLGARMLLGAVRPTHAGAMMPVEASFAAGLLEAALAGEVNIVNSELLLRERGIEIARDYFRMDELAQELIGRWKNDR